MKEVNQEWNLSPEMLELSNNEVQVWLTQLDRTAERIQQFRQILSTDEQKRADRFYFDRDRHYFIVGRGILRSLLGRYLQLEPNQIQFQYSDRGKPTIANSDGDRALEFNVSHSNGLALYAIARAKVGIDLECIRPIPDAVQLANRFFTPNEATAIATLSPKSQQTAFFNAWTRKEAYLKATGDGLAGLDAVEVSLLPEESATLVSINGDRTLASQWTLFALKPHPNYAAAVVVEGTDWHWRYFQWRE